MAAALEAILASPQFLFRLEPVPTTVGPTGTYRIGDIGAGLAAVVLPVGHVARHRAACARDRRARCGLPASSNARRAGCCAISRAEALATRFASQWLRLQDIDEILPDALLYPYYDNTLGKAFRRETELFFESLVREDRSVLELLTADYTFVNERHRQALRHPERDGPRRSSASPYRTTGAAFSATAAC